jgi:hypothetical protein
MRMPNAVQPIDQQLKLFEMLGACGPLENGKRLFESGRPTTHTIDAVGANCPLVPAACVINCGVRQRTPSPLRLPGRTDGQGGRGRRSEKLTKRRK